MAYTRGASWRRCGYSSDTGIGAAVNSGITSTSKTSLNHRVRAQQDGW